MWSYFTLFLVFWGVYFFYVSNRSKERLKNVRPSSFNPDRTFFCSHSLTKPKFQLSHPYQRGKWDLTHLQGILKAAPVPIVNKDVILQNSETLWSIANSAKKQLRVATKSIRVPTLIDLVTSIGTHEALLMCYSVKEAAFLIKWSTETHEKCRFNDCLIAYPTVNTEDVLLAYKLNQSGHKITLMLDSEEHVAVISNILRQVAKEDGKTRLPVCIDVDCSLRLLGVHLGAHRSPCYNAETFEQVLTAVLQASDTLRLAGVMTYEAQIAGVGDSSRHAFSLYNYAIRLMKRWSKTHVHKLRQAIMRVLMSYSVTLDFFNGGGTGNIEEAAANPILTEVAAGSGFLQPELFDYYVDNVCAPALAIALQITRIQASHKGAPKGAAHNSPQTNKHAAETIIVSDVVCCQSGGFIASGPVGSDKAPSIFLPRGLTPFTDEGFGEVQTPLSVDPWLQKQGLAPKLGDYVLIRPAKSGEVAERFPKYLLVNAETGTSQPPELLTTYRGFGKSFY